MAYSLDINPLITPQNKDHEKVLRACKEDPLLFGRLAFPTMFQVSSPPFHREIISTIQEKNVRVNIIAPRGHAKSSLVAGVFPLWHIFFEPGPKVVLLVSKTEGHTIRLLQTIKNVLDYSIPLRSIVGYWGEHSAKKYREAEIVLKDDTLIACRGTGQQVVGLKHNDQRPTLIIVDDPEDMNNTKTAEAMEVNLRWLLQQLIPARDPTSYRIIVIGTPQHERCIVEVLKQTDGWKSLHYSAIQRDGTPLWPEWWSYDKLMEEKNQYDSIGRISSFYREYMCQIIGDEDQLFKQEYIQYYLGELQRREDGWYMNITHLGAKNPPAPLSTPRLVKLNIFMGVDPASSTSVTADYSTIVPIGIDVDGNRYVLPYYRKRVSPLKLAEAIIEWYDRYLPERTRIESVGYQEMLREFIREKKYIPGTEIRENPRTSKSHRLETLQPFFAQRRVYLRPDMKDLEEELLMYPRGRNDDLLDGLYYANKNIFKPDKSVIMKEPEIVGWDACRPNRIGLLW